MNAPFQPQLTSLRGLAIETLKAVCGDTPPPPLRSEVARLRVAPAPGEEILVRLADLFALSEGEMLAAALCHAAETDPRTARLVAAAQAPVGGARPLTGFLATLFDELGLDCVGLLAGAGCRAGLFAVGDEDAPLPERSLRIPPAVVAALSGRRIEPDGLAAFEAPRIPLPPSLLDEARVFAGRSDGPATALVIRSPCEREAEALAAAVARFLAVHVVELGEADAAGHACWLEATRSLPLIRHQLGPGECRRLPALGAFRGPLIVLAGSEGMFGGPLRIVEWTVKLPGEDERAGLWRSAGLADEEAALAARTYRQGPGRIAEIAGRIAPGAAPVWQRLTDAVETGASQLDMLARRSSARVELSDLVVPAALGDGLDLLVDRVRLRNRLADGLGSPLRARYRPGVRALFTGESGTGKTLAAHWLARRSGLPLYRVDLAAMTSKWIGETEKNLSRLLDAAQHADVLLFFDEADSLFGARTDVGDSHDRFANAQTNYLLQRIEDFDGVAILATNRRDRFDPAFVRRLDSILDFPLPDPAARSALWRSHLGEGHDLGDREIDSLSVAVDLAGGHIRNIVLGAAVRARGGERPLTFADVAAAAAEEYAKLGRASPVLERW